MADGSVTIEVTLTKDQLEKGLKSLKSTINSALPNASKTLSSFANGFSKLGSLATSAGKACSIVTGGITGIFAVAGAKAKNFVTTYEGAINLFKKKLGDTGAKEMYDSLLKIAKGSTFAQESIVKAGQTLVAMGVNGQRTAKYMQLVTDAVAGMGGTGADIESLGASIGKMSNQVTLHTDDLNQLATQGLPVWDVLAKKYGKSKEAVQDMASKGLIPATETLDFLSDALEGNIKGFEEWSVAGNAMSQKGGTLKGAVDSLNSSFRTFSLNLLGLDPRTDKGKKNIEKLIEVFSSFGDILVSFGDKFSFVGDWISDFLNRLVTVEETIDENGNVITIYGGYLGELKKKLESLTPEQLENIAKAILEIAAAAPALIVLGKTLTIISGILKGFSSGISIITKLVPIIIKMGEVIRLVAGGAGTLSEAMSAIFGTIGTVITGVASVITGAVIAITNFIDMLKDGFSWLKEIFMVIGVVIAGVGAVILGVPAAIAAAIGAIIAAVATLVVVVKEHWQEIMNFFSNIGSAIASFFTNTVPNIFNSLISFIQSIPSKIWEILVNGWNSIVAFFTETIPQLILSIISWVSNLPYQIGYQIGLIIGHIIQFGVNIWNWVTTELPNIINGIIQWFSELPSKIWEWLCNVVNNIITWGQNMWNNATTWVANTVNGIIDWFKQLPGSIWTWLQNTINKIINFSTDMAQKGKQGAVDLFNNIVNTIKELPGKMLDCGKNIVEGLWNGIKNTGNWIKEKIGEFANGILDGMKNALGIHSPSILFRDEVGKYIALGVGEGFDDNISKVYDKMSSVVNFETAKLSTNITAEANYKASKDKVKSISTDSSTTINNTQNFYEKNNTPYEQQKQARQQLRRLAYDL